MPVSTRSRANLRDDEQDLRAQTSHEGSPQRVLPTIRIGALSDRNVPRSDSDIGDVPIPNESVESTSTTSFVIFLCSQALFSH